MHLKAISCRIFTTRWFLPAFTVVLGLGLGGAQWKGGDRQTGLTSIGFFIAIAAVLLLGGRSETIRMIRGDGREPSSRIQKAHGHGGARRSPPAPRE